MTNQTINDDAKDAHVSALSHALRTMRRHGFIGIQDKPGSAQSQEMQLRRAQQVAADMLGLPVDHTDGRVLNLAGEIVKVANAAEELAQFK